MVEHPEDPFARSPEWLAGQKRIHDMSHCWLGYNNLSMKAGETPRTCGTLHLDTLGLTPTERRR